MKTIEERAKEYAVKRHGKDLEFAPDRMEAIDGYIKGATEQMRLDSKQLCEMIFDNREALIDEACEWLREFANFSVNDNTGSLDEQDLVERFRKAMSNDD